MKKNSNTTYSLLTLFIFTLLIWSCKGGNEEESQTFLKNVKELERTLADSISKDTKAIKVIGYNTYKAQTEDEFTKIKELAETTKNTATRQYYFASDGSFYRVYFPIADAIIKYEQRNIPTDENGILVSLSPIADLTLIELAGKYVRITEEEKKEKKERPIQFLRTTVPVEKKSGSSIHNDTKICVFSLGERKLGDEIAWQ
ncbi:MAG: hypothetical protein GX963_13960 [Bacteroidales bacterium]|nr:hypothetical protein [Bacteroidales bacterium]